MLNPAIYRTIFNLDKDRKDLPAGNSAVPYPGAASADGGEDDLPKNPTTDIKPYLPVPKPPTSRPAGQAPEIVPVQETAEESVTIDEEPYKYKTHKDLMDEALPGWNDPLSTGISEGSSFLTAGDPATKPKGMIADEKSRAARAAAASKYTEEDFARTGKSDDAPTEQERQQWLRSQGPGKGQAAERDAFFDATETAGADIPVQLDRAAREAQIQEQAKTALGVMPPLGSDAPEIRPGTAKQQRRGDEEFKYNEDLKAALTYENPTTPAEKKQNRLDELKFRAENPRNEDHGIKGFIKETLQNFFFGLSKAGGVPGISMGQALMLGGAGAGAGMLNRGWNEQRMAEDQLGGAQQDLEMAESRADKNRALGIKEQEQGRKEQADLDKVDYWNRSLAVKEEYQKEYFQLQENRAIAKAAFDKDRSAQNKRRLDQIDERMGWIRQQDKIKNAQADRRLDQIDQKGKTNTKPGAAPAAAPTPAQAKATLAVVQAQYDAAVAAGDPNAKVIKQRIEKFKSLHKIK